MMYDFITETVKWKVDGDQIIIMGDINAYVELKDTKDFLLTRNQGTNY